MKSETIEIQERVGALSRTQVASALGVCCDTLDAMHRRGEGPPRFRASPRRWAYPANGFKRWQEQRCAETAA